MTAKIAAIFVIFCGLLGSCGVNPRVGTSFDSADDSTHAEKMGWVESQDPAASRMLTGGNGTE